MKEIQKAGLRRELSILMDDANNLGTTYCWYWYNSSKFYLSIVLGNKKVISVRLLLNA